jgi:DNA gyrase subunit A
LIRDLSSRSPGESDSRNAAAAADQPGTAENLDELKELREKIADLKDILATSRNCASHRQELREVQKKYGDARRTEIVDEEGEIRSEDSDCGRRSRDHRHSHSGYLKRTPFSYYRNQGRGGKGASA